MKKRPRSRGATLPPADGEWTVLKGVVENTNEAIVTIDRHHQVRFFNRAAERTFGYRREEVIGHDLDVIMSPSCARDHHRAVERYIEKRAPRRIGHDTEIVATRKGGETFPANISFSVSVLEGELYFTAIVRDLTETKALQEQVARSERLAAMGQVVAEITHEIKNPLIMIGGFAAQLVKETAEEKSLKKLHIIAEEVARLEALLRELRDLYTPRKPETERLDMGQMLREIRDLAEEDCRARGITLTLETEEEAVAVLGDPAKLKQVFLNLVRNAIEALEEGGSVNLRCRSRGSRVLVSVEDNGTGITSADQGRVFSPFFTTKRRGTGLGLSISKRIIDEHVGSTMTFESEAGKGTIFTVSMPLYRSKG